MDKLKLETGDNLLQETADKILLDAVSSGGSCVATSGHGALVG